MSEVKLSHASAMKAGSYILIDGVACIVRDTQTSKPGKHGHAKIRIKAVDIIGGGTKEIVKPGHDNVEIPIIYKKTGQILSVSGDSVELMDMESYETVTASLKIAEDDVRDKIKAGQTVMFWLVTGKVLIKQITQESQ